MKHYSGDFVRIVSSVRDEDCNEPAIDAEPLRRWFKARGFEELCHSEKYLQYRSEAVESTLGPRPEIDVGVGVVGDEVESLYCRFLLTRHTPSRLEAWQAFVRDLCDEFCLRISVSDNVYVGPDEFLPTIRGKDNWRYFADNFGWTDW
jgi:hypothetical protein